MHGQKGEEHGPAELGHWMTASRSFFFFTNNDTYEIKCNATGEVSKVKSNGGMITRKRETTEYSDLVYHKYRV